MKGPVFQVLGSAREEEDKGRVEGNGYCSRDKGMPNKRNEVVAGLAQREKKERTRESGKQRHA